jgi:hypothetical protein
MSDAVAWVDRLGESDLVERLGEAALLEGVWQRMQEGLARLVRVTAAVEGLMA